MQKRKGSDIRQDHRLGLDIRKAQKLVAIICILITHHHAGPKTRASDPDHFNWRIRIQRIRIRQKMQNVTKENSLI